MTGLSNPADLAVDTTHVYWTDTTDNAVYSAPLAGGLTQTLATGQASPLRIVLDDTHAYWSNNLGGAVMRAPKDGTGAAEIVAATTKPSALVVDGTSLYWSAEMGPSGESHPILRAPKQGIVPPASPTVLTAPALNLVTDGAELYVDPGLSRVYSLDKASGELTYLFGSSITSAFGGSDVCGLTQGFSPSVRCRHSGSASFSAGQYAAGGYVDDCGVFLSLNGIQLVAQGGNLVTTLVAASSVGRMVTDSDYIYWTAPGAIGRVRKP